MNSLERLTVYLRGLKYLTTDGFYRLTPKQQRRLNKKARKRADSPTFDELKDAELL